MKSIKLELKSVSSIDELIKMQEFIIKEAKKIHI